eukprot:403331799
MNEKAQNQLVKLVESKGKYKQKIQKKDETIKLQEKQIQGLKKDLQDLLQYIENKQQQYKVLEEKHVQMFSDFMHQFKMISNQWIMSQQIRQNMEIDNISGLMSNSTKDTENASARNSYQLSDSQSEFSFGTNQFKRDSDKAQFQLINTSVKSASIPNLMSSTIDQVNKSHASGSSGSCKFQNDASVQLLLSNKHDEEGRPPSVSLSQSTNIPSQSAQSLTEQN